MQSTNWDHLRRGTYPSGSQLALYSDFLSKNGLPHWFPLFLPIWLDVSLTCLQIIPLVSLISKCWVFPSSNCNWRQWQHSREGRKGSLWQSSMSLYTCSHLYPYFNTCFSFLFWEARPSSLRNIFRILLDYWYGVQITGYSRELISLLLLAAKCTWAKVWKQPKIPSVKDWMMKVWDLMTADKVPKSLLVTQIPLYTSQFLEKWFHFLGFIAKNEYALAWCPRKLKCIALYWGWDPKIVFFL